MSDTPPSSLDWKISSASGGTNCVEVAFSAGTVLVRDSKDRDGGMLQFPSTSWRDFVAAVSQRPGR
jgi:Domain of unknown function (DUF397)